MRRELVLAVILTLGLCGFTTTALANTLPAKEVALTFDDGPYGTSTAQILDILEKQHAPATFFLVGKNVLKYPDLARREVADGDLVGNHTYDHAKNLASSTAATFRRDLDRGDQAIASTTGVHTRLFRPPYSKLSATMNDVLQKSGYTTVLWDVDPQDWDFNKSPTQKIVNFVLTHVKSKSIIVLHDGRDTHIGYPRGNTINALPILINKLRARGYTFVTVNKLLQ